MDVKLLTKIECPKSNVEKEFMRKIRYYQSVVGSLMYAMIATRLDIPFAMGPIEQIFIECCLETITGNKTILRYVSATGSRDECVRLGGENVSIIGYSQFFKQQEIYFRLHPLVIGGAISWSYCLQNGIVLFSAFSPLV